MTRIIFRANVIATVEAWRAKKARLYATGGLGALQIADATNAALIPDAFPGRIRSTVHAMVGPSGGTTLGSVVGVVDKPLFWWYTKGTGTHVGKGFIPIDPIHASALVFQWERIGGYTVAFSHVENPGTRPHPEEMAVFLDSLRVTAYDTWRLLLTELLRNG